MLIRRVFTVLLITSIAACGTEHYTGQLGNGEIKPVGAAQALPQGSRSAVLDPTSGHVLVATLTVDNGGVGSVVVSDVTPQTGAVVSKKVTLPAPDDASALPIIRLATTGNVWLALNHQLVLFNMSTGGVVQTIDMPDTAYTPGATSTGEIVALRVTKGGLVVMLNGVNKLLSYDAGTWSTTTLPLLGGPASTIAAAPDGSLIATGYQDSGNTYQYLTAKVASAGAVAIAAGQILCASPDNMDDTGCLWANGSVGRYGSPPQTTSAKIAISTESLRLVRADSANGLWFWAAEGGRSEVRRVDEGNGNYSTANFPLTNSTAGPDAAGHVFVPSVPPTATAGPGVEAIVPLGNNTALILTPYGQMSGNSTDAPGYDSMYLASL